ncbi:MAG: transferase [Deltaproteobacteria bacterium RIFCSPLOWO2_12_FULL_44_12]|nr:MAG: transferase [Deltaproteobacteria bacterium RIFCSPHIGHO2_01_FULL_43_49]OGQ15081.1 MAG: transferase [Deltaproteobacteria bacterium RIFCSPHIGHO2_02_FULL_44_53]OGQ27299.1 MAG: transferase [Deltaproteobacteria bacterium RIFCSPHIGHO2_12_FULL_44_21]OGQ31598.1 MAG: transferase [Deltaproteobacteria bacterium RIFCSPLOWO2_01_FULL_45_74]OGQ42799.1 MAG: transferase [Deltaproteobacteria bacterium RIFCSPLOWO2_02_FULL_44_34]OGQ69835.1 MAG: transferase [Deltaproteobacteria bacterium RIFCSPLOWO2_12_FULL
MISSNAIIYPNTKLGKNCIVEDFCIIGIPPVGQDPKNYETIIGDNAVIRSHTVIYAGNIIGKNFKTGNKTNIREGNQIGDNVSIGTLSVVEHHVTIGNGVRVHTQAFIPEYCILEDGCWIGPNVVLTNAKYPNTPMTKQNLKGVVIDKNAVIGANATILPGVIVGASAIVGAGAVVTKNVDPKTTVAGNPAKCL